jgi:hypothetical protein
VIASHLEQFSCPPHSSPAPSSLESPQPQAVSFYYCCHSLPPLLVSQVCLAYPGSLGDPPLLPPSLPCAGCWLASFQNLLQHRLALLVPSEQGMEKQKPLVLKASGGVALAMELDFQKAGPLLRSLALAVFPPSAPLPGVYPQPFRWVDSPDVTLPMMPFVPGSRIVAAHFVFPQHRCAARQRDLGVTPGTTKRLCFGNLSLIDLLVGRINGSIMGPWLVCWGSWWWR